MKKLWKIIVLILLVANLCCMLCSGKTNHHQYPMAVWVYAVDDVRDTVTFVDGRGEMWEIDGAEDWMAGDVAAMLMDDNGTEEYILDDIVVEVLYGFNILWGWSEA